MASTSASSDQKSFKYDVFLNFRGEDTRKNFVDHLYQALQRKGIITYKDDEKIQKGERIKEQLIRSIDESKFNIIVFSKNYASSSWCLDELVKIMECQKIAEHTAFPVFYDVEPTQVRNQSGPVGEAFEELVSKGKRKRKSQDADLENEDVGRWRCAMEDAAGLVGWELKNTVDGHEAKFIQKIVIDVSLKLSLINWSFDENLVGMETRVKNVVSSLEIGVEDVRMIGIKGMGGSGKTTLATAIFYHISTWFEGISFIENVREVSKSSLSGLKELQKQVLSDVLNDQSIVVKSVSEGKIKLKRILGTRKVLVVLDDVDHMSQLEALAGTPNWYKPGSRVIITTRDEQVLKAQRVNFIHDVNLLSNEEAVCLFSRHAFGQEIPIQGYIELSGKVVHYAAGLPLTIKVLGSHLCGKSEREWEDAIERVKKIPLNETMEKLELSYIGLEDDQKEIFLDVVCLLKGETKDDAIRILESAGFNAQIGLRVLEQKSLITISDSDGLRFHDHIEEMGWNIVRRMNPDNPSRHTRLWIKEEIKDILFNESGTQETKCIKLNNVDLHPSIIMKGLTKMKELRYFYVHNGFKEWEVDEVSQYLPDSLRSLCWHRYPFGSLPKTFRANKLVNLEMFGSNISELWQGGVTKVLDKLRFLDLSRSKLKTFDLGMTPHLETLDLAECLNFEELHIPNECPTLKYLNLTHSKVSNLNLEMTPHLEELHLEDCYGFVELHMPVECQKLKALNLSGSKVSKLNLGMTPHIEELDLGGCCHLQVINAPVGCLKKLVYLNLSGCLRFEYFLVDKRNALPGLDSSPKLELTGESLDICPLHPNHNYPKFMLECSYDESLPSSNGNLEKLLSFGLCACTNLEGFSATISDLQHLRELTVAGSIVGLLKDLGRIQSLEKLSLWSEELKYIPDSICMLKHLKSLGINSCYLLEQLPKDLVRLECLEKLIIKDCGSLQDIPNSICKIKSLTYLNISGCHQVEKMPEELGCLERLEKLDISRCKSLQAIPNSIGKMKTLTYLNLSHCPKVEKLPEELGCLERLEKLDLSWCEYLQDIPNSIGKMKSLTYLDLSHCLKVEKLPEELGCLECLEKLDLSWCESLQDIPNSICKMKSLTYLNLSCCFLIKEWQRNLGV